MKLINVILVVHSNTEYVKLWQEFLCHKAKQEQGGISCFWNGSAQHKEMNVVGLGRGSSASCNLYGNKDIQNKSLSLPLPQSMSTTQW